MLTLKHINALNRFAQTYGPTWRQRLVCHWATGKALPERTSARDAALLGALKELLPADAIRTFKPVESGYANIAFLKKDRMERFNVKRGWFVNGWRLMNAKGSDLIQPWSRTKTEARDIAKSQAFYLVEA